MSDSTSEGKPSDKPNASASEQSSKTTVLGKCLPLI